MDQEQQKTSSSFDAPQRPNRRQRQDNTGYEELRTLFMSGLPVDVKEREIHNMFRFFPGYEGCVMNMNESVGKPVCFASFTDRNSALRALRVLHDVRFDPNVAQTIRVEFAKTNSKTRRLPAEFYAEKRRKAPLAAAASPYFGAYAGFNPEAYGMNPGMLVPWFQNMSLRGSPPMGFTGQEVGGYNNNNNYNNNNSPQTQPKVPPCSTLFVANLHPDVQERDLLRLFRIMPGFRRLRLSMKDGLPICFVEYSDEQSSSHAMNSLQGVLVGPSNVRIEFAKTRMGDVTKRQRSNRAEDEGDQSQNTEDGTSQAQHIEEHNDETTVLGENTMYSSS